VVGVAAGVRLVGQRLVVVGLVLPVVVGLLLASLLLLDGVGYCWPLVLLSAAVVVVVTVLQLFVVAVAAVSAAVAVVAVLW